MLRNKTVFFSGDDAGSCEKSDDRFYITQGQNIRKHFDYYINTTGTTNPLQ